MNKYLLPIALGLLTTSSLNLPVLSQTNPPTPRPNLRIGSQGVVVAELQAALKLLGFYPNRVDGNYAESTVIAVSRFQQAAGLNPDGIMNTATWEKLFPVQPPANLPVINPPTATNPPTADTNPNFPILREGMRGEAVKLLQERLRALGFLQAPADGVFGTQTLEAVKAAQARFSLQQDGIVGSATWRALLSNK